jgi:hypothetical protein
MTSMISQGFAGDKNLVLARLEQLFATTHFPENPEEGG